MAIRVSLKELCDKLGVATVIGPYETHPWTAYDTEKGITCQAEVHMSPSGDEVEAEAQMMYDTPPSGKPPMEQICHIRAVQARDGTWSINSLKLKGAPYGKDIYDWEGKSCVFFSLLVGHLQRESIPDIDELIEEAFHAKDRFGNQRQGGGGKGLKVTKATTPMNKPKGGAGF